MGNYVLGGAHIINAADGHLAPSKTTLGQLIAIVVLILLVSF